ncbi:MAG: hypothetical protein RIC53_08450 [Cyclobacteriaceae bacterium]
MLKITQSLRNVAFFILLSGSAIAQESSVIYADALKYMDKGDYELALDAFSYIPDYQDTKYRSAISALLSYKYQNTPIQKLLDFEDSEEADKLFYYWVAQVHLKRFHLEESAEYFNKFLNEVGNDNRYESHRAEANEKLFFIGNASSKFNILPFESPINSKFADIPGTMLQDGGKLIFMSDRHNTGKFEVFLTDKGDYGWNAPAVISDTPLSSELINVLNVREALYFFDPTKKDLTLMELTDQGWNTQSDANIEFLEGANHIYLNKYQNRIIFSKRDGENGLDLYESFKLRSTGKWLEPTLVVGLVNSPYSEDYPFLTDDRKRLYFSSNRPGGVGKMDIYYCELNEQTNMWGKPINAGIPVNSVDDDISFTMLSESKGMISSNRIYSSGDLDLFVVEVKD